VAKPKSKPTGWNRPLAYPLELRDGHEIETMKQAAGLITKRLPKARQEKKVWQHAAALLMQAHESGKRDDIRAATDQLHRALIFEGWMT
jgi:redox-regulated HSP33 family molecular chaperone